MRLQVRLSLLFVFALTTHALWSSTAGVYVVGNCKPTFPSFTTISAALAATPAPTTVQVCPGTYNEQVEIDIPVTLQGITSGNSGQAIIAPPAGDLVANATDQNNHPIAAQIWVNSVVGAVTISNLTVDATGNGSPVLTYVVGVFFQNSSGTVNRVVTRNQKANSFGAGIWVEGGAASPTVTVENSSLHDFDSLGIYGDNGNSSLTLTVQNNDIDGKGSANVGGIFLFQIALKVTGNRVRNVDTGIGVEDAVGTISNNVFTDAGVGGAVSLDANVSVTNNKITGSSYGIILVNPWSAPITGNTIAEGATGIEFNCNSDVNVHGNIINDVATGLSNVPALSLTNDQYLLECGHCPDRLLKSSPILRIRM